MADESKSPEKQTIFLVEDTRFFTSAIKKKIEDLVNVKVVSASSLEEARQELESGDSSHFLAILDLRLPDAPDGEIVDYVASMNIPIIVFSSEFSETVQEQVLSKKVIDYVLKDSPSSLDRLATLVGRLFHNQSIKVLAVDDSTSTRTYIRDLLLQYRFQVKLAADGMEALATLEEHPDIRLMITDYYMPKLDGFRLIKEVRKTYSSRDLAIIGMSASGSSALSAKFIKHGADDFINKPFLREEFFCRISHNLNFQELFHELSCQKQQLEVLNGQKDQLFSIIAHDLRGPFNAILGFSELLSTQITGLGQAKTIEYADHIHKAGIQASLVLDDLLEWSSAQTGLSTYAPEVLQVSEAIDAVFEAVGPQAKSKNIHLDYDKSDDLITYADVRMLDTILRNLIGNAIKFTPSGGRVSAGIQRQEDMAAISIIDTGVGMKPEVVQRLFKIGESASIKGTNGEAGTGLGLHLCKTFVDEHGGELTVRSAPGKGSTFSFSIPLASPHLSSRERN